ncbi:MAG: hypothetical protein IKB82_01445 [Clostridia bacterium]|nr:hypothetical protein [Clostridia bacterium]
MTIRLFDMDPQLREFDAQVLSCEKKGEGYLVTLDRTAFFPEGGGQGADHGTLGGANVLDVHEHGGVIEHLTDAPLAVGTAVSGCVDSARRLSMSQQHSGEHMFSGLVCRLFDYDNVGFHIGSDAVTMDFNGPLTEEDVLRVERLVNEGIWKNIPIEATVPDKAALEHMHYRSKKAIDGDVRIVNIEGMDTCACCGTHMPYTGGVGQVKVIGLMKYKSGVRVSILCGVRALEYENMIQQQAKEAAKLLSVKLPETAGAVERLLAERDRLRAQCDQLGMRLFEAEARAQEGRAVRVVSADMLSASQLRPAAGRLAQGAKLALVLAPREGGWNFAMSSQSEDVRPATRALCTAFGGKGGGPKDMTQGVLGEAALDAIRARLEAFVQQGE